MEVVWATESLEDLDSIYEFIARDNEFYAKQVGLEKQFKQLIINELS